MKFIYTVLVCLFACSSLAGGALAADGQKHCGFFAKHFMGCKDKQADTTASTAVAQAPVATPKAPDLHEYLIHGWFVTAPGTGGDPQASCDQDAAEMLARFTKATGIQDATATCDEPFSA